jgi:hypothetical protein
MGHGNHSLQCPAGIPDYPTFNLGAQRPAAAVSNERDMGAQQLNAQPQKSLTREIWVLNNYGEDFEVESTSSKEGIIKVLCQEKVGNRYKFELEIIPPRLAEGKRVFTDVFYVKIKGHKTLELNCRGFYSN